MAKKITNYSVLILICISLSLLLFLPPVSKFLSQMNIAEAETARSFNAAVTVDSSAYALHPHAAIDDNGYVYVTYEDYDPPSGILEHIDFIKSTDDGATFGSGAVVKDASRWYPRIAVNTLQDAYVIKTYKNVNFHAYVSKSTHPGGLYAFTDIMDSADDLTMQGAMAVVQHDIATENVSGIDNVCAVIEDDDTVDDSFNIYCGFSTDEGASWGPIVATAINTNSPARYPAITAKKSGESDFYAAWVYIGNSIQFDYTTDAGATWHADTPVSGTGTVQEQRPGLAAIKDTDGTSWVFAVWCASVSGIKNVYFDYTTDYTTWHTDVPLGSSSYHGYDQDQASIAACVPPGKTYPHLYAAWRDTRDNHIYFQEATWTGSAFRWGIDADASGAVDSGEEGADLRVSDSSSGSEEDPTVVASSTGEVYVIWHDTGSSIKCARYGRGPVSGGAPSAPTSLSATGSNGRIDLDWADNSEADLSYYKVYRSTTRGTWSCIRQGSCIHHSTSQYADVPLASISISIPAHPVTNSTAYWYVVTAVDTEGKESAYSNDARATPNGQDVTAPNAPTGLAVTAGNTQIALAWAASTSTDVSSYHIYRSNVSGCSFYYVSSTSAPVASYLNSSLANGTKYYYVVTALDASNNESADSNEANATTTGSYTPGSGTAPDPAPDGGGGGGPGGGCFIATASYGSPFAEEVRVLSRFRDVHLTTNIFGRAFVRAYCKLSPPAAKFISGNPVLKFMVRLYLKPLVKLAKLVVG